ncbi:MAG TPA: glycosyltransferase family 4 protein [Candidatus Didemnitutus sp.]|nr:glycosyltransferase family 4 protein [Candidatus Didemnitutus sp.]
MSDAPQRTVLHYVGYDHDAGGIVSTVRALASTGRFACVLGLNKQARHESRADLPVRTFSRVEGETIGPVNWLRTRRVAKSVRIWLRENPDGIFHGHSRAGLLVGEWLHRWGEKRVVVSVHCYGRQRWFYRRAAAKFGARLFWLTPAMRNYYGISGTGWEQCLPGGVTEDFFRWSPAKPFPGQLRLGGAGEISVRKNWNLVLGAMAELPRALRPMVSFEHIGAPAHGFKRWAEALKSAAKKAGISEQVTWRGPEPSSHRLLSSIDLLVVPSRDEPYSMILQESLAAGVPVIAADSGGPADVVQPGKNGWLFRTGDHGDLSRVLRDRLTTSDWADLDRAAIRATARRASEVAGQWAEVYREVSSGR